MPPSCTILHAKTRVILIRTSLSLGNAILSTGSVQTCLTRSSNHSILAISPQLSSISNQLSTISYQQSALSYHLSAISYQQSAISNQLSAINHQQSPGPRHIACEILSAAVSARSPMRSTSPLSLLLRLCRHHRTYS
jgi:hypothetical protein